jgi:hypothetical protein
MASEEAARLKAAQTPKEFLLAGKPTAQADAQTAFMRYFRLA